MALNNIIESGQVYQSYLVLRFKVSPRVTSLDTSDFRILQVDEDGQPGDPVSGTSYGIRPINIAADYNSISKRLVLYFMQSMTRGDYFLEISQFHDANGTSYIEEDDPLLFPFTYDYSNPDPEELEPEAARPPVEVKDYSIQSHIFVGGDSEISNNEFFVVSSDPANQDIFIDSDYRSGNIKITFNKRPNTSSVNEKYIKVQRKEIGVIGRWKDVDAKFSVASASPVVNVFLPGLEDSLYNDSNDNHYESGYKYRIRLGGDILSTNTDGASEIPVGESSTIVVEFRSLTNALVPMDSVEVVVVEQDATPIFGSGESAAEVLPGVYSFEYLPLESGSYEIYFNGTPKGGGDAVTVFEQVEVVADYSASTQTLLQDYEIVVLSDISPLYVDPEEVQDLFPGVGLVDIAEVIHKFSTRVQKLLKNAEPNFLVEEYVFAAVACHLLRTSDGVEGFVGDEIMTLGDFSIRVGSTARKLLDRATASSWCELAEVLRQELMRGLAGMRAVVKGTRYKNPIPKRYLRDRTSLPRDRR